MADIQLVTASEVDPAQLNTFLHQMYSPEKSTFLIKHGNWWHASSSNRLVSLVDGQVAGYCAVIPAQLQINGKKQAALWLVDIMVNPVFRGRGLQRLSDQRLRKMTDLLVGFPNELAAKIHRKHGWGVRQDMRVFLLPLRPTQVKGVRNAHGGQELVLRGGALILGFPAALWRKWLRSRQVHRAWKLPALDMDILTQVFLQTRCENINTTWRDLAYFEWRYGMAPHPETYSYYLAGTPATPTHYLIAHHITQPDGLRFTRILDIFGDFNALETIQELLILAIQDAIRYGAGQVTLLASLPELQAAVKQLGFIFSAPASFCWLSDSAQLMEGLGEKSHWTLGDSDNDALD